MDTNWSDVEKSLDEAVKRVPEHAREEAKKHGTPIYTEDDTGVVIKEYPDGRKVRVVKDDRGQREIPLA